VEGAALPADTLAMARQLIPQLGRLPELLPPRLLAHAPVRAMQRPLLQLAVRSTWRLREEPCTETAVLQCQPLQPGYMSILPTDMSYHRLV